MAHALAALPAIEAALRAGHLVYSVVRELTRVATPCTEQLWIDRVRGTSLREVMELVAGRRRGDLPGDPPDPDLRTTPFVLEVTPRVHTLLLAAIARLRTDTGHELDDDTIAEVLAQAVLGDPTESRDTGRGKYQVAFTVCRRCDHAEQQVHGYTAPVSPQLLERVRCDATLIGDIDAAERASQTIPPAVVRFVWHRDQARCRTPGCGSKHGLELHHIVRRADGGSHDPSNLTLCCSACHQAHHDGLVTIGGVAPDELTFVLHVPGITAPRTARVPAANPVIAEAVQALVGLGFTTAIARVAVDEASDQADAGLPSLIRAALAKCPRPCT